MFQSQPVCHSITKCVSVLTSVSFSDKVFIFQSQPVCHSVTKCLCLSQPVCHSVTKCLYVSLSQHVIQWHSVYMSVSASVSFKNKVFMFQSACVSFSDKVFMFQSQPVCLDAPHHPWDDHMVLPHRPAVCEWAGVLCFFFCTLVLFVEWCWIFTFDHFCPVVTECHASVCVCMPLFACMCVLEMMRKTFSAVVFVFVISMVSLCSWFCIVFVVSTVWLCSWFCIYFMDYCFCIVGFGLNTNCFTLC